MNQLPTSAVREICTLRSVGAGVGDRPGNPVAISDGRPYRDNNPESDKLSGQVRHTLQSTR